MQTNAFPAPATLDGYQRISGACSESEQVYLRTGNFMCKYSVVDVPTVGQPLRLVLFYNHQDNLLDVLGTNWRHNYMMKLLFSGVPATQVTLVAETGRQYGFVLSGSDWVPDGHSFFLGGTLTHPGGTTPWKITFPDGSWNGFDVSGRLSSLVDRYGNTTTLTWSHETSLYDTARYDTDFFDSVLLAVTEPTGRQITLDYTGGLLTRITDPRGSETILGYTGNNLTSITGPEGCVTGFGWDTATPNRITSRTDARNNTFTFSYHDNHEDPESLNRLWRVEDPEAHAITYTYDTYLEHTGGSTNEPFRRTILVDARSHSWEFHFDLSGNLWRLVNPLGHTKRLRWDSQQKLIFQSEPFQYGSDNHGPGDNYNNAFHRYGWDLSGNLLYTADASGLISAYTYDGNGNMLTASEGQANLAVQGNWPGHYGSEGYLLCAFDPGTPPADRESLPSYVSAISPGAASFQRVNASATVPLNLMDPRAPLAPDSLQRSLGFWEQSSGTSLAFEVGLTEARSFNLSVYSHSADMGIAFTTPMKYHEQFGRDLEITVVDLDGTQSFRVHNNAPGAWVTFTVRGDASNPVVVTVAAAGPYNTDARISALAFDSPESHRTRMSYNATNDLVSVIDPLGNETRMTYHSNGTLASILDAMNRTTRFAYGENGDLWGNLTSIQDAMTPTSGVTSFTYDANGNVLTVTNPNLHTWTYAYDQKDRLTTTTDPLGHETSISYDATGNIAEITDANGKTTQFFYTSANRVSQVMDADNQSTFFSYDAAGNLIDVTDPMERVTTFEYDALHRMIQVTRPDGTTSTQAYDAQDRLRAVTGPNGTQSDTSRINVLNAFNWLKNPGAEEVDPSNPIMPRSWTVNVDPATPPYAYRDSDPSHAHSGQASFFVNPRSGASWIQGQVDLPAGTTAMVRHWTSVYGEVTMRDTVYFYGFSTASSQSSPPAVVAGGWQQRPWFRFTLAGDSQYTRYPLASYNADLTATTYDHAWYDDFEMVALSTALLYDAEGRPTAVQTPDGAVSAVGRDRHGRVVRSVDPRGRVTALTLDALGRVTRVIGPDQDITTFQYDAASNLVSFTDPRGSTTQYAYDALDRLVAITYPDASTELFTYDSASNLATYTNNRGQQRSFAYDAAERLVSVVYETDSTQVSFTYDFMDHALSRTERNGDVTTFRYDNLYRMRSEFRSAALGSSGRSWAHSHTLDAVGNRTAFSADAGTRYGSAHYGQDTYGAGTPTWQVPGGYNDVDLAPSYKDRQGQETLFGYDVEGNRTTVTRPGGATAPVGTATYDIVNRLAALDTVRGTTDILPMSYGYDQASNRVGMVVGDDTFDYGVDDAGQLIEECINRFVQRRYEHFRSGTGVGLDVDAATGEVTLLTFADSFAGNILNANRWRLGCSSQDFVGLEVRQNDGLEFVFPRGYSDLLFGSNYPPVYDPYGLRDDTVWVSVGNRIPLSGDFDVQVDFSDYQGAVRDDAPAEVRIGLLVEDAFYEQAPQNHAFISMGQVAAGQRYRAQMVTDGTTQVDTTQSSSDTSGRFRITRSGSTVNLYYWTGTNWSTPLATYSSFVSSAVYVALHFSDLRGIGAIRLRNFTLNAPLTSYPTVGTYTSAPYDAARPDPNNAHDLRTMTWDWLSWQASTPVGTSVRFQVATSDIPNPVTWDFVGPDGTSDTCFLAPDELPASLSQSGNKRYLCYQATFTGDGALTPVLYRVDVGFSGTTTPTLITYEYDVPAFCFDYARYDEATLDGVASILDGARYDQSLLGQGAAGNLTRKVTETPAGITTEVRDAIPWSASDRVNALNQIQRVDVTPPGGSTTSWRYAYDASGNLTSKSDGTDTWLYAWDEDNRLTQVTLPGGATVSYTYDMLGRMLTRTTSSPATTVKFEWDGWDCIREYTATSGTATYDGAHLDSDTYGSSGVTVYYVVNGELMAFDRDNATYQIHADALGSVRMVTGPDGTVLARFDYDAWGNLLDSSYDNVPGGVSQGFVGALGVRWDATTGLHYMRNRWYDPGLGRFVSRDPIPDANLYRYGTNKPATLIDPSGLDIWVTYRTKNGLATERFRKTEGFINFVESAKPLSITVIDFHGHGNPTLQNFDVNDTDVKTRTDYVMVMGDDVSLLGQGYRIMSLSKLVRNKLDVNSEIWFDGCSTASGPGNLTEKAYNALKGKVPGLVVYGFSLWGFNIRGFELNIGIPTAYGHHTDERPPTPLPLPPGLPGKHGELP